MSKRDDAPSQPPHLALAHHGRFEVEADPDAKPEHERTNPLPSRLVVGDGRQFVDREHKRVNLLLGAGGDGHDCRPAAQLLDSASRSFPLGPHFVEGLGERLIADVVLLSGHPLPRRGKAVVELCYAPPQMWYRGVLLVWHLAGGLGPRLRQEPLPDGLAAARLRDALDERVDN